MLNALGDPYTTYLSPREIDSLEESLKGGDFGGIGVYIVQDARTKQILVEPIEGTPAYRAGVKTGDRILAVDGRDVATMQMDDVERLIRGKIGTVVHVRVRSRGAPGRAPSRSRASRSTCRRSTRRWKTASTTSDWPISGRPRTTKCARRCSTARRTALRDTSLDLRNNGGGLLEAAVEISSLFIPQGTIVSTIDRAGNRETKGATHDSIGAAPLVLLVNKYTASASEITAGAVQDYKVGNVDRHEDLR